jgi:hypothetical protein
MDSSVSPKDEIWFLRVCHHISTGLYYTSVVITKHRLEKFELAASVTRQHITTDLKISTQATEHPMAVGRMKHIWFKWNKKERCI